MNTHKLVATFKSGNGRRVEHTFPITAVQATDSVARAQAISSASFYGDGRGWRIVNWKIENA